MKSVVILFETDLHASKSSRICLGVFDTKEKAVSAAKKNDCYNTAKDVQPLFIECNVNEFGEL